MKKEELLNKYFDYIFEHRKTKNREHRACNALVECGVWTVEQITRLSPGDIAKCWRTGPRTVEYIEKALDAFDLKLSEYDHKMGICIDCGSENTSYDSYFCYECKVVYRSRC